MTYNHSTYLNAFLPTRIHPQTKEVIEGIVKRFKPTNDKVYYGVILAESTVVAIIKNNPKILVIPTGNSKLFQLILKRYQHPFQLHQDVWEQVDGGFSLLRVDLLAWHDWGLQTECVLPHGTELQVENVVRWRGLQCCFDDRIGEFVWVYIQRVRQAQDYWDYLCVWEVHGRQSE